MLRERNYDNIHMVKNSERKEKTCKKSESEIYDYIEKKWKLSKSFVYADGGGKKIEVWELRSKRPGVYGYTFDCIIKVVDYKDLTFNDREVKIYRNCGCGYRASAFSDCVRYYMGIDIFHGGEKEPTSGNASLSEESLIALFKAVFPGEKISYESSDIIQALNY